MCERRDSWTLNSPALVLSTCLLQYIPQYVQYVRRTFQSSFRPLMLNVPSPRKPQLTSDEPAYLDGFQPFPKCHQTLSTCAFPLDSGDGQAGRWPIQAVGQAIQSSSTCTKYTRYEMFRHPCASTDAGYLGRRYRVFRYLRRRVCTRDF